MPRQDPEFRLDADDLDGDRGRRSLSWQQALRSPSAWVRALLVCLTLPAVVLASVAVMALWLLSLPLALLTGARVMSRPPVPHHLMGRRLRRAERDTLERPRRLTA
ncbi:hypothetical protein C7444_108111 [Sphaerotilus hippei]|uniref:Uncharacterized protein n=1 Tax=Sphaerotilus hippei TaxID=744406 RepID=A0A318H024_9BURK|nr:hypothetical protein [Sphaerotilus hippei]PXW95852.1 hypothetical protein C7444_108111 [Sphaerotilus hippei]